MNPLHDKYAALLVHYCLELKPGERLFISTTTLAEPLVREVYRHAIRAGAHVEVDMAFRERNRILLTEGGTAQLQYVSPLSTLAMEEFNAYLAIRAPFNLREEHNVDGAKAKIRGEALSGINQTYFKRIATKDLKRNLCQFPTEASAQEASMSLEEYEHFVYGACFLLGDDPVGEWLKIRAYQQGIVDHLNKCSDFHYKGNGIDIRFSAKGRTWINSDGRNNMPSGEVFTSPVEDSANGTIHFDLPGVYQGHEVEGVTLWVKDGYIEKWEATRGKDFLDHIFAIPGTRRFGEAAVGTNYNIQQITKNILFDEKIGGTVHMAIGQSYLQCGGKNESTVHWDMITSMTSGGEIFADGEKVYENGRFVI